MATSNPHRPRTGVRFAVPPTLADALSAGKPLQSYLTQVLGKATEIVVPQSYEMLAKELLSGKVDAAWAPPFVCARIEAMGVRVLVRGVRDGASTYRAALLCRADSGLTKSTLQGTTVAWSDRDSVAGYLLPMAWLRDQGFTPAKLFFRQDFVGSYKAALELVATGAVDLTSVFAPSARVGKTDATSVDDVWRGHERDFRVLAYTDESPNDGVAVSLAAGGQLVADLERAMLSMKDSEVGREVMRTLFHAERFEPAPRMGYRALYRVALASL